MMFIITFFHVNQTLILRDRASIKSKSHTFFKADYELRRSILLHLFNQGSWCSRELDNVRYVLLKSPYTALL
jgi:hypothetical protein